MSTWKESVVRIAYVVCDVCSSGCDKGHPTTAAEAVRFAQAAGWVRKDGKVLCPECQPKS